MKVSQPKNVSQDVIVKDKKQLTEHELLIRVIRLQAMLNSKLFEFLRAYQQSHNFGESGIFRDGSGSKTRVARLMDEVNEIGLTLNQVASTFVGENLFEVRDGDGRVMAYCNICKKESPFDQIINRPHGIPGAFMDGTERLVCHVCRQDTIYPSDSRMPKFNSVFRTK